VNKIQLQLELRRVMKQRNLYRELLIAGNIIGWHEPFTEVAERVRIAKELVGSLKHDR